jgi:uncharacterized protein YchJ
VAVAALSSVAGCSQASDGNNEQESTEDPSEQESTENTTPQNTSETTTSKNTTETPKETVRSYLTAIYAGEVQAANALIHPDGNISEYTEDAAERNEALDLTIQSVEITEESENTATVNAVVSLKSPKADEELTRSQTYTLRTDNGTWKLYDGGEDEAA